MSNTSSKPVSKQLQESEEFFEKAEREKSVYRVLMYFNIRTDIPLPRSLSPSH